MAHRPSISIGQIRILSLFLLVYVAVIGITSYLKFDSFQYGDFDLAVHTQSLHNLGNGSIDCSILGLPFPGNHMAIALLLIAPFYWLIPSPVTILLLQTLILAAGGIAVFLYANRHLPKPYPLVVACAYFIYPPLILMNLYEFHPIALVTTFMLFALLSYDRRAPRSYILFLLLSMACQENVSLIVVMLGIKAFLDRRPMAWIITPILVGLAWFMACIFWIMPQYNPGIIRFDAIYGQLGESLPEILKNAATHPVDTFVYMFTGGKLLYLLSLAIPLALMSLLAPLQLLPALPVIAQRLLSCRGTETTILFHYQAELIPFIFVAAIHGLRNLGKLKSDRWQRIAMMCIAALAILALDLANIPSTIASTVRTSRENSVLNQARRELLKDIPRTASAAVTFRYLPHLANRENLHSIHHIYTGYYTLSRTAYPTPTDIDLVIIDRDDPLTFGEGGFYTPGGHTNLNAFLRTNRMIPAMNVPPMVLLMRDRATE